MTDKKRVRLYERLPEIYRIRDAELPDAYLYGREPAAPYQLRSFLEPVEEMFSAIHENIESLYHDFFIETCDEWVIPYIADLLGTTHLSGEAWTRRADVADTIALRRRKGTRGAVELLTYILTKWGVHSVELRENLAWNQHLDHQRPDAGGAPPYGSAKYGRAAAIRGGTANLRDPSLLAQLGTPFDPFARVADLRPAQTGRLRVNLPNLAIFLWRLQAYRIEAGRPFARKVTPAAGAARVVRVNVNPIPPHDTFGPHTIAGNEPAGRPLTLFNTSRFEFFGRRHALDPAAAAPRVSSADEVPAPIPVERLSDYEIAAAYDAALGRPAPPPFEDFAEASFTAPHKYAAVETYDAAAVDPARTLDVSEVGFQLHLPEAEFPGENWPHRRLPRFWKLRGENLCAWEKGLRPPLGDREIAVDPRRGRVVIGVSNDARADALVRDLRVTFTYGAVGAVGAHPVSHPALPAEFDPARTPSVNFFRVRRRDNPNGLRDALAGIAGRAAPTVIELADSETHRLDLADAALAADVETENGVATLKLGAPLIIRAADNRRPIVALARPLAFRPAAVVGADAAAQKRLDAAHERLFVRLEGLFVARAENFADYLAAAARAAEPLVRRAALNRLEILGCTLDPGGFRRFDGTRAPVRPALALAAPFGFDTAAEELAFKPTPEIDIQRSITGPLRLDADYRLCLTDSIVDAGQGVGGAPDAFALASATAPTAGWAAPTVIANVTFFGRVRTAQIDGRGGIFVHALEVENRQAGCLKFCYFSGAAADRRPPQHACVTGAALRFTSECFGDAAYGQLAFGSDRRILEEGAGGAQMGAFNFLQEAHKWRNLQIRFREFMPVGVRPILIPVT